MENRIKNDYQFAIILLWVMFTILVFSAYAIGQQSAAPVIITDVCGDAIINNLNGTSTEDSGTEILLYQDNGASIVYLKSTNVDASGGWQVQGLSIKNGSIYATAQAQGKLESDPSNEVEVVSPINITIANINDPTTCSGLDGSISLSGLTPLQSYNISYEDAGGSQAVNLMSDASGVITIASLSSGEISNIQATFKGCESNTICSVNLEDPIPPALTLQGIVSPIVCGGLGSITLEGGNAGENYNVSYFNGTSVTHENVTSNGAGEVTLSDLPVGTYSDFTITKDNCESYLDIEALILDELLPSTISLGTITQPSDCNTSDGSIEINGVLPTTSYDVFYENEANETTSTNVVSNVGGILDLDNLGQGTYRNLRVQGPLCFSQSLPTVDLFNGSTIAVSNSSSDCTSGEISLSGLTPSQAYTLEYRLDDSNVQTNVTADLSGEVLMQNLDEGIYSSIVVKNGNCQSNILLDKIDISYLETPSIALSAVADPSDCATSDGSIQLAGLLPNTNYEAFYDVFGGTQSVDLVSDVIGELTIPNLAEAEYSDIYVLTDDGCQSNTLTCSISVEVKPSVVLDDIIASTSCSTQDGQVQLSGLDPITSFDVSYVGENGSETLNGVVSDASGLLTISNLEAGYYTNLVVDNNGCLSDPISFSIEGQIEIYVSAHSDSSSCAPGAGFIELSGFIPNQPLTMHYSTVGGDVVEETSSNGDGEVILSNLENGQYFDFYAEQVSCTTSTISAIISIGCTQNATYEVFNRTIDVLENNDTLAIPTDPDGDIVAAIIESGVLPAGVSFNVSNGIFSVSNETALQVGATTFTVRLIDDGANETVLDVTITILNDKPVANNDTYTVDEASILNVDDANGSGGDSNQYGVIVNDSDVANNGLTVTLLTSPSYHTGTFTLNANGTFEYVHIGSEIGNDSFTYILDDNDGKTDTAQVSININIANARPIANPDEILVESEGSTNVLLGGNLSVLDNDFDSEGTPLQAVLKEDVENGTLVLNTDGSFSYTHTNANASSDSFIYAASDGDKESNSIEVRISIQDANAGPNNAPVAVADEIIVSTGGNASVLTNGNVSVLQNDTDADGDSLVAILIQEPMHGSLSFAADGTFQYQHDGGADLSDSFEYAAFDGSEISNAATVSISIESNSSPIAVNDEVNVTSGGSLEIFALANDFDLDGSLDASSIVIHSSPSRGTVQVNSSGTIEYQQTSSGSSDVFSYSVSDDRGLRSNIAIVSISFTGNSTPVANSDEITVNEGDDVVYNLLANDFDFDDNLDDSSIEIITNPQNGTVTVLENGNIEYVHNGEENEFDEFQYAVSDTEGLTSNTATVFVSINPVNDAPIVQNDLIEVGYASTVTFNILANDTDAEGEIDPSSIEIKLSPAYGTLTILNEGNVAYTHNSDLRIDDRIEYTVKDMQGLESNVGEISIEVIEVEGVVDIPNVFTPNGDGNNDNWIIDGIEDYPNNKVIVYNRWGNKVFEIESYDNNSRVWFSQISSYGLGSDFVTEGTYFYVIHLDSNVEPLSGFVVVNK